MLDICTHNIKHSGYSNVIYMSWLVSSEIWQALLASLLLIMLKAKEDKKENIKPTNEMDIMLPILENIFRN